MRAPSLLLLLVVQGACAFSPSPSFRTLVSGRGGALATCSCAKGGGGGRSEQHGSGLDRRLFIGGALAAAGFPSAALSLDDPTMKKFSTQAPPTDKDPVPFTRYEDGVSYKEYKAGKGGDVVGPGKRVSVQMTGRLLNLNGVKFYSTKEFKDEFGDAPPLSWTFGAGQALPGLEEGMAGMKKGSLRKIIVPPEQGYASAPDLLPQPSAAGRPSLDSVLKNPRRDATIVFEVLVEGIK